MKKFIIKSFVRQYPALKKIPYLKSIYLLTLALKKLPLLGVYDYFLATILPYKSDFSIRLHKDRTIRLRNNDTDILIFKQIFLLDDVKVPISYIPKTIIDGGAHIGCASIYYAIAYPDAKIIAVEAEESNFKQLCENVREFPQVKAVNAAIFGSCGVVMIQDSDAQHWGFRVTSEGVTKEFNTIPAVTIDTLMSREDWECIDLLKLDIEGSELEVFTTDPDSWLDKVKVIVVELHDLFRIGCTEAALYAISRHDFYQYETVHNKIWIHK